MKNRWRLLFGVAFLLVLPILSMGGKFCYEMTFKETLLLESQSPNRINQLEVVQKGSPFFFGLSSVQIEYGWMKQVERSIGNDGKMLDASNVSISWKNDYEATVVLYGEEQTPVTVDITFPGFTKKR